MTTKKQELPDYWSVYRAINKQRISKSRVFLDKKSGKEMEYSFLWEEKMQESFFLQLFSWILWMSPVLLIIFLSILMLPACPYSLFSAIPLIIAYHFAAMYYIIRGPHIQIMAVKKKGIFSKK